MQTPGDFTVVNVIFFLVFKTPEGITGIIGSLISTSNGPKLYSKSVLRRAFIGGHYLSANEFVSYLVVVSHHKVGQTWSHGQIHSQGRNLKKKKEKHVVQGQCIPIPH